jgi:hypothetical protein
LFLLTAALQEAAQAGITYRYSFKMVEWRAKLSQCEEKYLHKPLDRLYYNRNLFLALVIVCIVGLLTGILPFVLIASINDTASGHAFLLASDWLGSLAGVGILLFAEAIFVLVYDWQGAVTSHGVLNVVLHYLDYLAGLWICFYQCCSYLSIFLQV